ncbi:MAG: adenylate/guanylate cyclase domain-containing protein [Kineosporiaceae bacterium]
MSPPPGSEPTLPLGPDGLEHSPARDLQRRLRGGTRHLVRGEAAGAAGVSEDAARGLWRALGFPVAAPEHKAFTDADSAALRRAAALLGEGPLDVETLTALARAIGQSTDRLVSWQTEALVEHLVRLHGEQGRHELVAMIDALADDLEALLVYTWRRQLAEAVARVSDDSGQPEDPVRAVVTVGFADLVSYTRLSHRLDQRALGVLVHRFEGLAADVVTAGGGRVVKTVGDEVLFTADDPVAGAVIALSLSQRLATDDVVPDVRVGLAHGEVLRSLGDVYGVTVNLASRLTRLAQPGTVITDPHTAALLADDDGLVLVPQRRRQVRGFGSLQPLLVARAGPHRALIQVD